MAKLAMPPHSVCHGGSLDTYSVDVGYSITPEFETSIGYYYQKGDLGKTDGSSMQGRIVDNMGKGFSTAPICLTTMPLTNVYRVPIGRGGCGVGCLTAKRPLKGVSIPLRRITQRLEYK
jgi:hypothetical protein